MKQLLVFLAVICCAYGAWEKGLRVTFSIGFNIGTDFFFPVPFTLDDVVSQGWTAAERPSGLPYPSLTDMYCSDDRIVCAVFDPEGNIAGMQIGAVKSQVSDSALDWPTQGFTSWTATTTAGETRDYWTTQIYFVSEETLRMSKEERVNAFKTRGLMREGAAYFSGFNGELVRVSDKYTDIVDSIFTRQACIPWMGRHFYYNMTAEAECTSDKLFPWFMLIHDGELVGSGLTFSGKHTVPDGERNWYENPTKTVVQTIVPEGAQCLYDLADNPGIFTMHIYYIDKPWLLSCLFN